MTTTKQLITTYKGIDTFANDEGVFSATPFGKRKERESNTMREIKQEIDGADETRTVRKDVNRVVGLFDTAAGTYNRTSIYVGIRMKDTDSYNKGQCFNLGARSVTAVEVQVIRNSASNGDLEALEASYRVLKKARSNYEDRLKSCTTRLRLPYSYSCIPARVIEIQEKTILALTEAAESK